MAEIIDSLREDHRNMHRLLDVLDSQIEVFRRGEEPDYELLTQTIDYCLNYPDHIHHPMEDEVYRHLSAKDPALKKQMGDLEAAHDDLSALTRPEPFVMTTNWMTIRTRNTTRPTPRLSPVT